MPIGWNICIAVLWLDIWKVLSQKEVSFLPFSFTILPSSVRIDFLNFCNKLVNINWKLKPLWIKPKETQNSRYSDHQLSADRPRSYYLYPFRFSSFFTHKKMKADQQTMTKNLSFKTKQSSVVQSVFKWQHFEEKQSFYQNHIQRFPI